MIRATGLAFRYPGAGEEAISRLDLVAAPGEAVGLAGASGCGKTTLIKLLAGIAPRSTGGVASGNAEIAGVALPLARGDLADSVGYVGQDPHAGAVAERVEDELAFTAENLGIESKAIERRIAILTEACGIAGLRRRRLQSLSGGERQRVQIAAALIAEPQVILLDEPTSQLDPAGVRSVSELLLSLRERSGTTILVAEHRLERIEGLVDRIERMGSVDQADPVPPRQPCVTGAPVLQVSSLSVQLEGRTVLEDVDLAVREGEAVAIVGPNGSGKTTLLRAILGFARSKQGSISVRRPVAWVPQRTETAFCRDVVRDEIAMTLRARRSIRRGDDVLAEHGLTSFADRSPRHLSSGERLRVALCALTAGEPRVVLLDEPTRGLDSGARAMLVSSIEHWTAEGMAVVIATHDEHLVRCCDRRVTLEGGRVVRAEVVVC